MPNLPDASVPVGKDASANVEVRRVGEPRAFDFDAEVALGPRAPSSASSTSSARRGSPGRASPSTGTWGRVSSGRSSSSCSTCTAARGYREVIPPYLVTAETLTGTGQLPKFEGDLFKTRPATATST